MDLPCLESDRRLPCLAGTCEQRERIKPSQTFFHRPNGVLFHVFQKRALTVSGRWSLHEWRGSARPGLQHHRQHCEICEHSGKFETSQKCSLFLMPVIQTFSDLLPWPQWSVMKLLKLSSICRVVGCQSQGAAQSLSPPAPSVATMQPM